MKVADKFITILSFPFSDALPWNVHCRQPQQQPRQQQQAERPIRVIRIQAMPAHVHHAHHRFQHMLRKVCQGS
jgi:hypothetical protein